MKSLFPLTVLLVALLGGTAQSQPAIEWTGAQDTRATAGIPILSWRFLTGCDFDVEVTALGAYDGDGDGLLAPHTVTITPLSGGPAVLSATVPAGTNALLEGHFRYVTVAPVKLRRATDYVITSSRAATSVDPYAFRAQGIVANPNIIFRGSGEVHDPDNDLSPGLFGGNFKTRATAVVAPATIRLAEVEICWAAKSNTIYQVQYRSTATAGEWQPLGGPVDGFDRTNCVRAAIPPDEPKRFYRVLTLCYE